MKKQPASESAGQPTRPRFGRGIFRPGILREMDTVAALEAQCRRICTAEEAKNRQGLMEIFGVDTGYESLMPVNAAQAMANRVLMRVEKHERDLMGIVKAMIPTLRAAGFVREERRAA